ncbi:MAG: hypothetical protein ACXWME_08300, partial [Syntrophales bacterium]
MKSLLSLDDLSIFGFACGRTVDQKFRYLIFYWDPRNQPTESVTFYEKPKKKNLISQFFCSPVKLI